MTGRDASRLVVLADGRTIEGDEARAIWTRFSQYMDEHHGDMDGFARTEGFTSARTEHRAGQAFLILSSREAAQSISSPSSAPRPSPGTRPPLPSGRRPPARRRRRR